MKYILTLVMLCGLIVSQAQNYYVGGTGASDSNSGTAASPFATINKAATVAVPGSTVYVRAGTYRETITPVNSGTSGQPITFRGDRAAIVSGLEVIPNTGWAIHNSGPIYKKTITLPITGYGATTSSNTALLANQIFRNGEMMFEASSRNLTTFNDLFDLTKWKFRGESPGTGQIAPNFNPTYIIDPDLAGLTLQNAKVVSLGWFISESRTITSHSGNQINFAAIWDTGPNDNAGVQVRKYYFVTGDLDLLNTEKEWHYDGTTLYFRQPGGGPISGTVEYKARNWGFNLIGKDYINIEGFTFNGCEPATGSESTDYCIINNVVATYQNHSITHESTYWQGYGNSRQVGVKLLGVGNTVKDSEFRYSGSQAVWIGAGGRVENNYFDYISYDGMWGCPVAFWGMDDVSNIIVTKNTMKHTGRGSIDNGFAFVEGEVRDVTNNEISYNDMSYFSMLNQDGGAFYSWGYQNLSGTRIHHNWVHDLAAVKPPDGSLTDGIMAGLYFDMGSGAVIGQNPLVVDHNVIWNMGDTGGFVDNEITDIYAQPSFTYSTKQPHLIYNNVLWGARRAYVTYNTILTAYFRNNISRREYNINWNGGVAEPNGTSRIDIDYCTICVDQTYATSQGQAPGANVSENVSPSTVFAGGSLSSPAVYFQPQSANTGVALVPYTDAVNVDRGAYELGGNAWTAGYVAQPFSGVDNPPAANAGPDKSAVLPVTSVVFNGTGSDVDGSITAYSWTKQSGPSATLTNAATQNLTVTGVVAGTYVFRLTVTDNSGATGFDEVTLIVSPSGANLALNKPTASSSFESGYPSNLAVDGSGSTRWSSQFADPQWIYVDLQASYTINRVKITWQTAYGKDYRVEVANAAEGPWTNLTTPIANNTVLVNDHTGLSGVGRYVRIYGTARGTSWGYSIFELEVYGTAASNTAPTANAGADQNITTSSIVINGTGTDVEGPIASYAWTLISGPNTPTLSGVTTANLTASGMIAGTYVFRLMVTDNGGLSATDDVSVVVSTNLALNKPTTSSSVESGYPSNLAVDGSGSTRWSSLNADPQWISVDLQAFYTINRVKITWQTAYGKDYRIEVANAAGGPWTNLTTPIVNNTLLVNDLTGLSGVGRYLRIYGTARGTSWGYSIFELEVYGTPAPNMTPSANAGTDKSIILPTSSVVINGTGSDTDGTITTYAWTRISGPNTPTLSGANTTSVTASGMIAGTYVFRLTVTDNGGLSATDDVSVVVYPVLTNLALNKPATASSTETSYTASLAVDGNTGTRWSSLRADPQDIVVDLQATYNIMRVKITWEVAMGKDYQIQTGASATGPWTVLQAVTNNSTAVNDFTSLSGTGRYIRVYGTARATIYGYSIFELEVYGTPFSGGRIATDIKQEQQPVEETTYSFKIFPNPANIGEPVKLELSSIPGDLIIFDPLGKSHHEQHVVDHYLEIPASKFGTGLYFFKYKTRTSVDLKRVIIK